MVLIRENGKGRERKGKRGKERERERGKSAETRLTSQIETPSILLTSLVLQNTDLVGAGLAQSERYEC